MVPKYFKWHFTQLRHFSTANFMEDLSRFSIPERIQFIRLVW